ncbi:MAG: hypothetical protein H0U74_00470 [Bradymonadaceae bacterium]|nr:hypothetical protein [Lujinxingiaceae bacterium]
MIFRVVSTLFIVALAFGCHAGGGGDELQPSASDSAIGARSRLLPTSHTIDWIARHGKVSLSNAQECASCHMEQDCASCHVEQLAAPYQVHPPNFLTIHSIDARANLAHCTDCHRADVFCHQCHIQTNFSPTPVGQAPPRLDFHPPGWLDARQPGNHGVMARRNINDCASCHSEQDCVSCHIGISPHPSEFRFECRRWLEANARPCAQCHGDLSALRMLCP